MRKHSANSSGSFSMTFSRRCEMPPRQWVMGSLHGHRLGDDLRWGGGVEAGFRRKGA